MTPVEFSEADVRARVEGLSDEQRNAVVCGLVGHSRIQTACFGYVYCARCEAQLGDTLGGVYDTSQIVIKDHDCDICVKNAESLTWKDTLFTPPWRKSEPVNVEQGNS
jgi:hypothetical protein